MLLHTCGTCHQLGRHLCSQSDSWQAQPRTCQPCHIMSCHAQPRTCTYEEALAPVLKGLADALLQVDISGCKCNCRVTPVHCSRGRLRVTLPTICPIFTSETEDFPIRRTSHGSASCGLAIGCGRATLCVVPLGDEFLGSVFQVIAVDDAVPFGFSQVRYALRPHTVTASPSLHVKPST
jgi:hypothetical protein